jgi:hypothetical protein
MKGTTSGRRNRFSVREVSLRGPQTSLVVITALVAVLALAASAAARPTASGPPAPPAERTLHFAGKAIEAPSSWPVYRLSENPGMCVRLDRQAVYLGTPSAQQSCPAGAIGRRRAILVQPAAAASARRSAIPRAPQRIATTSAGGAVFTGLGFDACSAPSTRSMAAWGESPYRAIGVYIGGENRACSQPNLTESWTAAQTAAGWNLIPTYVGSQAPTSSCSSCAKLTAAGAATEGAEEAVDAVADATEVGIGPGSPIYFDMESYSRTTSATNATLTFLAAWTDKLHSLGYLSGVYSSSSSGIVDLAGQLGTGYHLPDALWIANWNNQKNTLDTVVPSTGWAIQQRIHQYQGGHNETYGGITINIDNDYVDGPTAGLGGAPIVTEDDPIGFLDLTGAPTPGSVRVKGWAFDPNSPTTPLNIRAFVGGRAGTEGAQEFELGPIANLGRRDILGEHPEAGPKHGFDSTFPTTLSGSQPVCVYALDFEPGEDTLLGCKATKIPVAVTISNLLSSRTAVHLRLTCAWPEGTECPGYLSLRTRFKVSVPRRHRAPLVKVVTRSLGRRAFHLVGGQAHGFKVPLTAGARKLLQLHGKLRTQVIAAIPGGKRIAVFGLEQVARR